MLTVAIRDVVEILAISLLFLIATRHHRAYGLRGREFEGIGSVYRG